MAAEGAAEGAAEQQNGPGLFALLKPQLMVAAQKAEAAVEFYKAAFGAEELKRTTHPKRKADQEAPFLLCAELKIGSSAFLVCDQTDDSATVVGKDAMLGGVVFRLETENVQGAVARAVEAGAVLDGEIVEEEGACGGGLLGTLKDPFGVVWAIISVAKKCAAASDA